MIAISSSSGTQYITGNTLIGNVSNIKIIFKGKNARVEFGKNFRSIGENNTLIVEDNANVVFEDGFQMGRNNVFFCRKNSSFHVGVNSFFTNGIRVYNRGVINLGNNFGIRDNGEIRVNGQCLCGDWVYFQHHVVVYAPKNTIIEIGSDSGASWYSRIIAGMGHSIYDMDHGIKLSSLTRKQDFESRVQIGDHVWLGNNCSVNNNVNIGNGSMVAANSNVRAGFFPPNSLIADQGKIILKNIGWDRRLDLDYDEYTRYKESSENIIERATYLEEFFDCGIDEECVISHAEL